MYGYRNHVRWNVMYNIEKQHFTCNNVTTFYSDLKTTLYSDLETTLYFFVVINGRIITFLRNEYNRYFICVYLEKNI